MKSRYLATLATAGAIGVFAAVAAAQEPIAGQPTATGKLITPAAAKGAVFQILDPGLEAAPERRAGYASAVATSPDGKRLAVLTSGFPVYFGAGGKLNSEASVEFVFIFDITGNEPKQIQVLSIPNTFVGLAWSPASDRLFVSAGKDDAVAEFVDAGGKLTAGRTFHLGHKSCLIAAPTPYDDCGPVTAGVAISPDGSRLLAANIQNDSVSLIDVANGTILAEQDLRPGIIDPAHTGQPGGSFPRAVAWISNDRAYVASVRDREVIALASDGKGLKVVRRIALPGQPAAVLPNKSGSRLYIALDTTGQVAVVDTAKDAVIETIDAVAPSRVFDDSKLLTGANTNALTLTPDGRTLLASDGGLNAVAVIRLGEKARGAEDAHASRGRKADHDDDDDRSQTVGLAPTGWYPAGVATSKDGARWYVVNSKTPMGPNSSWCHETGAAYCKPTTSAAGIPPFAENGVGNLFAQNMHVNQLEHAGFLAMPAPDGLELARLTRQVAHNNGFDRPDKTAADAQTFAFLRAHIKHVIYIMKENRTYDQILGDLGEGNGDRRLTLFPEAIAPNHHALARNFVDLDNLLVTAEGSVTGNHWTFGAESNDMLERTDPLSLASEWKGQKGSFPYGSDREAMIAYATPKERHAIDPHQTDDPNILPGTTSVYAADGPGGEIGAAYIWDAALRGGLSVRDYGVGVAGNYDVEKDPQRDLRSEEAKAKGYKTVETAAASMVGRADPYWPTEWQLADFWRVREWKREFQGFVANGGLPNLSVMWLPKDHLGGFDQALDGVNTPETQMADNDYAVGALIEAVANSPYAKDTLIVVIEDDPSDGPDHVDAQRSIAMFAGPYVRQHAVVSTRYTTVNVVKTIDEVLGIGPIGLNDALAAPMSDVFDLNQASWTFKAIVPDVLRSSKLPLPKDEHAHIAYPKHSAAYWTKAMADQDFSGPDRIEPVSFNHELWRGLMGDKPYPVRPTDAGAHDRDDDGDER